MKQLFATDLQPMSYSLYAPNPTMAFGLFDVPAKLLFPIQSPPLIALYRLI